MLISVQPGELFPMDHSWLANDRWGQLAYSCLQFKAPFLIHISFSTESITLIEMLEFASNSGIFYPGWSKL